MTTAGTGHLAALWAVVGTAVLLGASSIQLGLRGAATIVAGLNGVEWLGLIVLTVAFVYGEGIRAIQRRYLPHVFRRIERLRSAHPIHHVLAPLYAMSLVGFPLRELIAAWAGVAGIVLAVVLVAMLPQPWRGIVDFAVASALGWATIAFVMSAPRALRR